MKRLVFVIATLTVMPLFAQQGQEFAPGCELPFDQIAVHQDFDDVCGIAGAGTQAPLLLQNRVKNNFCATGDPVLLTFTSFKKLQTLVEKPENLGPKYREPDTRDKLQNINYTTTEGETAGEGTLVTFAAFIEEAHFADTDKGEGVNCKMGGAENNDVHIALASRANETDECKSVTAEMSPHFRPPLWAERPLNSIGRPVRITGQLFFDASHHPCSGNKRPNPKRVSSWEIHPVYNIEVCKKTTLASCKADDDGVWESFDEFMNPAKTIRKEDETEG